MKLEKKKLIVKREYKEVYKCEDGIVKIFENDHPKADVFNEALNTARVEATGLDIPCVKEVSQIDGKWALLIEYKEGTTLEAMMNADPENLEKYMEDFVDLQLEMHSKKSPRLNKLKDKLSAQINGLKELDATTRYELLTRLESMPKHDKVCHGDFNPSNDNLWKERKDDDRRLGSRNTGKCQCRRCDDVSVVCLERSEKGDLYMKLFCKKSDTARQYVQQWLPIVAAAQLSKNNEMEKEFLMQLDRCDRLSVKSR